MELSEVCQLIKAGIPGCEVLVSGEACNFSVIVVAETFAGLSLLKRQQAVLEMVKAPLATGELHAISMKVYTPDEWLKQQRSAPL